MWKLYGTKLYLSLCITQTVKGRCLLVTYKLLVQLLPELMRYFFALPTTTLIVARCFIQFKCLDVKNDKLKVKFKVTTKRQSACVTALHKKYPVWIFEYLSVALC